MLLLINENFEVVSLVRIPYQVEAPFQFFIPFENPFAVGVQ